MLTAIELFCGVGGTSFGFLQEGFSLLAANDIEPNAIESFRANHGDTLTYGCAIEDLQAEQLLSDLSMRPSELDVVLGGPPCQGFSTYGQRSADDQRNFLFREYARMLRALKPKYFVFENVTGILSMLGGKVVQQIRQELGEDSGYSIQTMVLNAAAHGVPQLRRRVFFVGRRKNQKPIRFPCPTHRVPANRRNGTTKSAPTLFPVGMPDLDSQDAYERWMSSSELPDAITVREAISDLPVEALEPKQSDVVLDYPTTQRNCSAYQRQMRKHSRKLHNHSAKRHMAIRQIRASALEQGDYGTSVTDRIDQNGLPDETLQAILDGKFTEENLKGIRSQDLAVESRVLEKIRKGATNVRELQELLSRGFANKYRRLKWDAPSHTVVAHMARDCSDFIHPEQNRPVSVREAARFQSFPDHFIFKTSQFRQFQQIGNAVPPLLGQAIAKEIVASL